MPTLDAGYPVSIVLDSDKQIRSLKPGMIGQVTIVLARKTAVLVVPKIAVRIVPAGNVVDVMLADGQLVATPIKAGLANDDYVELADNTLLREGDKIVLHADTPVPPLATPTPAGTPGKTPTGVTPIPGSLTPGTPETGSATSEVSPTPTFHDALALTPAATPTPIETPSTTGGPDINRPAQPGTVVIVTQGAPSPSPVSTNAIVPLPPTLTPGGTANS